MQIRHKRVVQARYVNYIKLIEEREMHKMMKPTRPEDILPDGADVTEMRGRTVRKGSVAAVVANAIVLESQDATELQKKEALMIIKELAPTLIAVGLHNQVIWKNPEIEKIIQESAHLEGWSES